MKNRPPPPDLCHERLCGKGPVCGVDEVGRGPWAGPLVAAAVIVPKAGMPQGVRDSKALSAAKREELAGAIIAVADTGLGVVEVAELDALGLTAANDLAMQRAVSSLTATPVWALVDGNRMPKGLPCGATTIVKGDALSLSIAAASIVAKVARDRIMRDLARECPGFGWETNAGYGVAAHQSALRLLGPTQYHRRSFRPVREILSQLSAIES